VATIMKPEQASEAILRGVAPDGLIVDGELSFSTYYQRSKQSAPLTRLPDDLQVGKLHLRGCGDLRALPKRLRCEQLEIYDSAITWLPADLQVSNSLTLDSCYYLKSLPYGLKTRHLTLRRCQRLTRLPYGLQVTENLSVTACENLEYLPSQLSLRALDISGSKIIALPADLRVTQSITAEGCKQLDSVPPLSVETLDLSDCTSLQELPDGLQVRNLSVAGCTALQRWPSDGIPWLRRLNMRGCMRLRSLPPGVRELDELDLRDCDASLALPERLRVRKWLDIGGLPWRALPLSSRGFRLRWNGVAISGHIVFHPESITTDDIFAEENAEVRRMMLEHLGYERFFQSAKAEVRHQDTDPGGVRQLLVVPMPGDEQLVCLSVHDPSTGRQYVIRVPPWIRECHQAAAWIAGFDDPNDYHPVAET